MKRRHPYVVTSTDLHPCWRSHGLSLPQVCEPDQLIARGDKHGGGAGMHACDTPKGERVTEERHRRCPYEHQPIDGQITICSLSPCPPFLCDAVQETRLGQPMVRGKGTSRRCCDHCANSEIPFAGSACGATVVPLRTPIVAHEQRPCARRTGAVYRWMFQTRAVRPVVGVQPGQARREELSRLTRHRTSPPTPYCTER